MASMWRRWKVGSIERSQVVTADPGCPSQILSSLTNLERLRGVYGFVTSVIGSQRYGNRML